MQILNPFRRKFFFKDTKYIPYGRQNITEEDIKSVIKVMKSDFLTQGDIVEKFENGIATKVGVNNAIAVNSATSALHIACLALGLGEEDYIWTSPITFVASANCGRYCRAKVDFVDIDEDTALISVRKLKKKLEIAKKENKLPKIIIPVHLAGSSCEMKQIWELSKIYGFYIIEDASHAIGGKYEELPVGNCKYSDITVFSFHPVKIITTAEGGVAVTNSEKYAERMRNLRSHYIIKDKKRFEENRKEAWIYEMQGLGFNYRMNEIQAALGLSQLKRLDKIVDKRNNLQKKYVELIGDLPVKFLKLPKNVYSSFHLAILKLDNKEIHQKVFNGMRKNNIGVQLHYFPVHLQPYYKKLGFKKGDFSAAEEYSDRALTIPLYPELKFSDLKRVSKVLKKLIE